MGRTVLDFEESSKIDLSKADDYIEEALKDKNKHTSLRKIYDPDVEVYEKFSFTDDISGIIGVNGQVFLNSLLRISTFADKYQISRLGVLRHLYNGDLPTVVIQGIIFIVDIGYEREESVVYKNSKEILGLLKNQIKVESNKKKPKYRWKYKNKTSFVDVDLRLIKNRVGTLQDFFLLGTTT